MGETFRSKYARETREPGQRAIKKKAALLPPLFHGRAALGKPFRAFGRFTLFLAVAP
jgi:hypothetical protein